MLIKMEVNQESYESIFIDQVSWLPIWRFMIIVNQILMIAYMEIHDFYRQSFMIAYMEIHDLKQPVSHDAYIVNIYDFINQDLINCLVWRLYKRSDQIKWKMNMIQVEHYMFMIFLRT